MFGRITAGFTHEIKNVLAIVKESSGLMEDLLAMSRDVPFPHRDRFLRALTTIKDQVRRGVDLSTRLNSFAHSPDVPVASVDMHAVIDRMAVLSGRFAGMKRVELKVQASPEPVILTISAVQLELALFKGMECCWNHLAGGGEVVIAADLREDGATVVRFLCSAGGGGENQGNFETKVVQSEEWQVLCEVMEVLEGEVRWGRSGMGFELVLPGVPR